MFILPLILLAMQFSGIAAAPLVPRHRNNNAKGPSPPAVPATASATSTSAAASATATSATGTGATEEKKEDGNTLDITGVFGQAVALGGNDQKTDILFTKGSTGSLEVEFQDKKANSLTVTENKTPGKAPSGFAFLEPSSFKIALANGADGLTLQKVDFIFDPASAAVKAVDISKAKVGKLCTDTNTFVVDDALGEQEFEDDENEVTLTVKNMIGEWGIFIPTATANAEGKAKEGDETTVAGTFDKAIDTPAGSLKTDILFTSSVAGSLEVEVKAAAANKVTVKRNTSPVAPPAGFLFVDPATFQISTATATAATDLVKVDYIFSAAVAASIDITKGVIGKLDTATNTFITDPAALKAEFEVEADENEWTLTVPDLNGEWAILIPESAVTKKATVLALA